MLLRLSDALTEESVNPSAVGQTREQTRPLLGKKNPELLSPWTECNVVQKEEGRRTLRKKKQTKNLKLQPYLDFWVSEAKMDSSCPAYVLLQCLSVPVCPLLPFFRLYSRPLHSLCFPVPFGLPHFPYFGMSMCYLLTLCMNANTYVYS